ncbi:MAG: acyltransferase, partial [Treponema sp.]|nr:acyltransferase [Spirochaetales bacterium]MDY6189500.1 acyltransferase [Treponema sp.]
MKTQILDKQSFQISEEDSKRITSLRFLLIVFVVFIHANLTPDDALNYYHYDFIQPKWIEVFKNFICYTLGGAAVPLFFLFASYLQFSKNDSYPTLLKKRSKSLLLPYILWSVITVILYFIAQSIPQTAPYFQNPINIVRAWKVLVPGDFDHSVTGEKSQKVTRENDQKSHLTPLIIQFPEDCQKQFLPF